MNRQRSADGFNSGVKRLVCLRTKTRYVQLQLAVSIIITSILVGFNTKQLLKYLKFKAIGTL
jgi:hypothetical protein